MGWIGMKQVFSFFGMDEIWGGGFFCFGMDGLGEKGGKGLDVYSST